jgi:2-hydroxy-3-keto-5-methylthiopentenyl-1-phosphate phosphatase
VNWSVLVDFDGSIAPDDPTDQLLARFADPLWLEIEAAWQNGELSSRECMWRQSRLLRVTPEALDAMIEGVRIDPGFAAFLQFCRRRGGEVKIVSDGFDRVIDLVLRKAGLSVQVFANKLEWLGGDKWCSAFPHANSDCRVGAGNCKCSHGAWLVRPTVVVGDGRSDFCMAERAALVVAKSRLAEYCRARGKHYAPFADFHDVTDQVAAWLSRQHFPRAKPLSQISIRMSRGCGEMGGI